MTNTLIGKITWVGKLEEGLQGNIKRKIQVVIQDKTISLAMWIFNDNIEVFLTPVEIGDKVTVEFSIKSSEYKGKWYTNCYCLSMVKVEKKQRQQRTYTYNPFDNFGGSEHFGHMKQHFSGCTTADQIKDRYRQLCKLHHPDTGGDEKIMQEVNSQYNKLK